MIGSKYAIIVIIHTYNVESRIFNMSSNITKTQWYENCNVKKDSKKTILEITSDGVGRELNRHYKLTDDRSIGRGECIIHSLLYKNISETI